VAGQEYPIYLARFPVVHRESLRDRSGIPCPGHKNRFTISGYSQYN